MDWEGVAFFTIADLVKPKLDASHVFFKSYDGYSTNNPLDACLDDDVRPRAARGGQRRHDSPYPNQRQDRHVEAEDLHHATERVAVNHDGRRRDAPL
jgi:DMSO/TMAO reductase YedYZ molybdopterin-dependent catalytic subunit